MNGLPPVLDVCCGSRMFWWDKKDPRAMFIDHRTMEATLMSNGATIIVAPDKIMDFRNMAFPDASFSLIVFDPPHVMNAGDTSFLAKKYGFLNKTTWREDLEKGFSECFRVLKPHGVLVFKWNECHIPVKEILALTTERPLFGNRCGKSAKTHWIVFIKTGANERITELEKAHVRYETVRKLNPVQFAKLYRKNIDSGEAFDSLVDRIASGEIVL